MALQNHASSTLNRVIAEGKCDLGVLQSILVYGYWKPPTDKSSWLKVGMALRMLYQLRLHAGRNNAEFPKEEHAARLLLVNTSADAQCQQVADYLPTQNSERTWYCGCHGCGSCDNADHVKSVAFQAWHVSRRNMQRPCKILTTATYVCTGFDSW
jgi:hypothetical protein